MVIDYSYGRWVFLVYLVFEVNNFFFVDCDAEEAETYKRIKKLFHTPTEIMEVFKALIFTKDKVQPIIDGSTNKTVRSVSTFTFLFFFFFQWSFSLWGL